MYFKKGDHVILVDNETTRTKHLEMLEWYPAPGTRGIVIERGCIDPLVQWEKGSTSINDLWYAADEDLILESEEKE